MTINNNFLVLEGLDGAGKSTQIKLLKKHLDSLGIRYKDIHFPKLNEGYYGRLIAEFLRGEFGSIDQVHPKLVALLFANDRKEHVHTLLEWMEQGYFLIADRYVNSNIAYQCAKCVNKKEKEALKKWILDFEFSYNDLPQPAVSFFLDVPFDAVEKSLSKEREGEDRDYLNGKKDIHEASLSFQQKVRLEYLAMTSEQADFKLIDCADESGVFLKPLDIHKKIIQQLPNLNIA